MKRGATSELERRGGIQAGVVVTIRSVNGETASSVVEYGDATEEHGKLLAMLEESAYENRRKK